MNDQTVASKVEGVFPSVAVIRHMNCRYIIETRRLSMIQFAKIIRKSPSYGSMLAGAGRNKTRISAPMARHIEVCFQLPEYFLDNKHDYSDAGVEVLMRKGNTDALSCMYLADFQQEKNDAAEAVTLSDTSLLASITRDRMEVTVAQSLTMSDAKDKSHLVARIKETFTRSEINALAQQVVDVISRDAEIKITKIRAKNNTAL